MHVGMPACTPLCIYLCLRSLGMHVWDCVYFCAYVYIDRHVDKNTQESDKGTHDEKDTEFSCMVNWSIHGRWTWKTGKSKRWGKRQRAAALKEGGAGSHVMALSPVGLDHANRDTVFTETHTCERANAQRHRHRYRHRHGHTDTAKHTWTRTNTQQHVRQIKYAQKSC